MQMSLFGDIPNQATTVKDDIKATANDLAFGIDLGTTNSCISVVSKTEADILPVDGQATMPSCVMWAGDDNFVVGTEAHKKRGYDNVSYSVKRLMGSGSEVTLTHNGDTKVLQPFEVSAEILKALVEKAKKGLYKDITDVVITVPAYFSNTQMEETLKAGELAGLNVLNLMKEPTAAALCYNRVQSSEIASKRVLIYDLGGGTFDVSLVEIINNTADTVEDDIYGFDTEVKASSHFQVLGVRGDMLLGGDDVDIRLVECVIARAKSSGVLTRELTKLEYERLLLLVESLKKQGQRDYSFEYGEEKMKMCLTASDFVTAFKPVYDKTKTLMTELLTELNMHDKVDQIITVGGSTKSEVIRNLLINDFPNTIVNTGLEPDLGVTFGAAIQAKRTKFKDDTICVLDCIPMNIGVLCDGEVQTILPANSLIPSAQSRTFQTQEVGQNFVELEVYQGVSKFPEECSHLGRLVIDDLSIAPESGLALVDVRLAINSNGILELKARVEGKPVFNVELVNVLGGAVADSSSDTSEPPKLDRKLIRWKALSKQLKGKVAKRFKGLLEAYEKGSVDEAFIVDYIKNNISLDKVVLSNYKTASLVSEEDE